MTEFQSDIWRPLIGNGFLTSLKDAEMPNAAGYVPARRDEVTVSPQTLEDRMVYNVDKLMEIGPRKPQKDSDLKNLNSQTCCAKKIKYDMSTIYLTRSYFS